MLAPDELDRTLRQFLGSDPFIPFFVEMKDGERILVTHPKVAFGGGGAAFFDSREGILVDFSHQQVVGFTPYSEKVGQ